HDGSPLPAQSREAGAGEAFAGGRVQDIVISDTHALLPPRIEHSRLQRSGSRGVGVRFRGDIEAALARAAYELEEEWGVSLAHARHVDHVQRSTGRGRVGDHLLQRRHAAAGHRVSTALTEMYEAGDAVARRHAEHAENLLAVRAGRVRDAEPDTKRALGEPTLHQGIEL